MLHTWRGIIEHGHFSVWWPVCSYCILTLMDLQYPHNLSSRLMNIGLCYACFHDRYDINYIEESMGWSRPLHPMGGSHDIPSSGSLSSQVDSNKMSLDSSPASSGTTPLHLSSPSWASASWSFKFKVVLNSKFSYFEDNGLPSLLIIIITMGHAFAICQEILCVANSEQ